MKTRNGFVSNSSSSSFIIQKESIPDLKTQFSDLERYKELAKKYSLNKLDQDKKWGMIIRPGVNDYETYYKYYMDNILTILDDIDKNNFSDVNKDELMYQFKSVDIHSGEITENWLLDEDIEDLFNIDLVYDSCKLMFNKHPADLVNIRFYYIIKSILDDKNTRKLLVEDIFEIDFDNDHIKKKYNYLLKTSSKKVYNELIKKLLKWKKLYFSDIRGDKYIKKFSKGTNKYIQTIKKERIRIYNYLYNEFKKFIEDKEFLEIEYEDGGGNGIYAPLLSNRTIKWEVPHIWLNMH